MDRGLQLLVVGIIVLALAVFVFGVTTTSGAPDWVSLVTVFAGVGMVISGLYMIFFRHQGRA